jgi:hypothetical protein
MALRVHPPHVWNRWERFSSRDPNLTGSKSKTRSHHMLQFLVTGVVLIAAAARGGIEYAIYAALG